MLQSDEYSAIKLDYDQISRSHFPKSYVPPPNMSFALSDAIYPTEKLATDLAAEYDSQCRVLCFGGFPDWNELKRQLDSIRHLV